MTIRLKAEETWLGPLLRQIETHEDAQSIRMFFAQKGVAATISPFAVEGYRVFLHGLTLDEFGKLLEGSNVELIQ